MSDVALLTRATLRPGLRSHRPLLITIALCVAAILTLNGVVGAGVSRYARSVQYRSALNLIELSSQGQGATRELDDAALRRVAGLSGVTGAYAWFQVDLALSHDADWPDPHVNPGALWGTPLIPGLSPQLLAGNLPAAGLAADEIVLPSSVPGGRLDRLLGKSVTMEFTKVVRPGVGEPAKRVFRVVGIADNTTPGQAGPTPSYLSEQALEDLYASSGAATGAPMFTTAYVRVVDPERVPRVQRELSEQGFAVRSVAEQLRSLGGLFAALRWVSLALVAVLMVFSLLVGGSVGASWVQQRRREIGLLSAIGWSRRRIAAAVFGQVAVLGAGTAVVGVLAGLAGSTLATTLIAGRRLTLLPVDPWGLPSPAAVLVGAFLTPLCIVLGAVRAGWRASRVDPDDALRDLT